MKNNCLVPKCNQIERTRGLCNNHYTYASRLVKKRLTTWLALEKKGKCNYRKRKYELQSWFLN
tara:strand:+ start:4803 stop:4991 length:189 start_codon:yes stop_codon:yes gene_type:complete